MALSEAKVELAESNVSNDLSDKMSLSEVQPGATVRIEGLENSKIKSRLMSMGLIKGTTVKVLRSAPLGDPMAVSVRSYNLALRVADAEKIKVSVI
uniref:FeoA family protein n=1 Tax=Massilibacillus massiliensis TaxID=1806837 RepID=UPI000A729D7F|nr:FeoA family protein [Massilibacillus massiliensis]